MIFAIYMQLLGLDLTVIKSLLRFDRTILLDRIEGIFQSHPGYSQAVAKPHSVRMPYQLSPLFSF